MIRQISASFVPVAVNLYKIRQARDVGGELFRSIQRQKDQYQGIWIVSPEGKVLAGHHQVKSPQTWTQEVRDTINAALHAFGPVTPRRASVVNPLPYRGIGVQPDGEVSLAVYTRDVIGGGPHLAPAAADKGSLWMWQGDLKPDGPPVIDSLTLPAKEWAAFAPPKALVGTEWAVPEAIARRFARALSPNSDQSLMPAPQDAQVAEMKARVESIEGGKAQIRLVGRWATKHVYDGKPSYGWATAEGIAVYDTERKAMRSLLLVFSGAFRSPPPWDKEDRPTGAVVEWQRAPEAGSRLNEGGTRPCSLFGAAKPPGRLCF